LRKYIFLIVFPLLLTAQSLEEVLNIAFENSLSLQKHKALVELADKDIKLSDKLENPKLKMGINDILLSKVFDRGLEPMQSEYIAISQKLPLNSKLKIKRDISKIEHHIERIEYLNQKLKLAKRVKDSFIKLSFLDRDIKLVREYKKLLKEIENLHKIYNFSSNTHYRAIINSRVLLNNIKLKEIYLKESFEIESLKLNREANYNFKKFKFNKNSDFSFEDLDFRKNIDLIKAKEELNREQKRHLFAKKDKIPDVNIALAYNQRESRENYLSFSLTIPLNIYDRENIQVAKALDKVVVKSKNLNDLKLELESKKRELLVKLEATLKEIELLREIVEFNRELLNTLKNSIEVKNSLDDIYSVLKELFELDFKLNSKRVEFLLNKNELDLLYGRY